MNNQNGNQDVHKQLKTMINYFYVQAWLACFSTQNIAEIKFWCLCFSEFHLEIFYLCEKSILYYKLVIFVPRKKVVSTWNLFN